LADIWLMRHAHYQGHVPGHHAHPDAPLSDYGRAQARCAVRSLPDSIVSVLTSTMPRAQETAEIICQYAGLPLVAVSGTFAEWRAPSAVLDRGPTDYPPAYQAWRERRLTQPDLRCEDGETLQELHHRATEAEAILATAARQGGVLLISHTVFLGVLARLQEGPAAFGTAIRQDWALAALRRFSLPS
jgi:broad specificity phosphatase PhoE